MIKVMKQLYLKAAFALLCALFGSNAWAQEFVVDGLRYVVLENEEVSLTGYGLADPLTDLIVPAIVTYDEHEYKVTTIDRRAFSYTGNLKTVTLGENVKTIGNSCFYRCSKLERVTLNEGLEEIGAYVFEDTRVSEIVLPSTLSIIECQGRIPYLQKLVVTSTDPEFATTLYENPLSEYLNDTELVVPQGMIEVYSSVEEDFESVHEAGHEAETYEIEGFWYRVIGDDEVKIIRSQGNSYVLPVVIPSSVSVNVDGEEKTFAVTSIGNYAFEGVQGNDISYTIPASVSTIGYKPFPSVVKITLGHNSPYELLLMDDNSVTPNTSAISVLTVPVGARDAYLGATPWSSFPYIKEEGQPDPFRFVAGYLEYITNSPVENTVTVERSHDVDNYEGDIVVPETVIYNDVVYTVNHLGDGLVQYPEITSVSLPNTITELEDYKGLMNCYSLKSVKLPDHLKKLGARTFQTCRSLSSIDLPESLEYIGEGAFAFSGLQKVVVPSLVTSLYDQTFGCESLIEITLPKNLTYLGRAFSGCKILGTVIAMMEDPDQVELSYYWDAGLDLPNATLVVPDGKKSAYQNHPSWSKFGEIVEYSEKFKEPSTSIEFAQRYQTFCSLKDIDFTGTDVKAWTVTGYGDDHIMLTRVNVVPAKTGVLLEAEVGTKIDLNFTDKVSCLANLLVGVIADTQVEAAVNGFRNFVLTDGANGLGFYPLEESSIVLAEQAYLSLPAKLFDNDAAAGRACLSLPESLYETDTHNVTLYFGDVATGMPSVAVKSGAENMSMPKPMYNLNGQRVNCMKRGLYVVGGKKVAVR